MLVYVLGPAGVGLLLARRPTHITAPLYYSKRELCCNKQDPACGEGKNVCSAAFAMPTVPSIGYRHIQQLRKFAESLVSANELSQEESTLNHETNRPARF